MPRLGLMPNDPKHRLSSRIRNNSHIRKLVCPPIPYIPLPSAYPLELEFPMFKKSRGKQILNVLVCSMVSFEKRELENRLKTLQLKKDLGLINLYKM